MAKAHMPTRGTSNGPSRSAQEMEAEFEEMDRLSQMGPAVGGADHLRLATGPRRPAAYPGPGQYASPPAAYPGPGQYAGPPAVDLERLVRGARRAAIFAAVMSTLALIMALGAALAAVAGLAA